MPKRVIVHVYARQRRPFLWTDAIEELALALRRAVEVEKILRPHRKELLKIARRKKR
jgi:hypothetical protein